MTSSIQINLGHVEDRENEPSVDHVQKSSSVVKAYKVGPASYSYKLVYKTPLSIDMFMIFLP
jgi:hypothetical protein